jgi:hypothetical protein
MHSHADKELKADYLPEAGLGIQQIGDGCPQGLG